MTVYIPIFLIILALVAVFLRAEFVLVLAYLLLGIFFVGRWWGDRALKMLAGRRSFSHRVFFGEKIPVEIEIVNTSLMPVVWLQYNESLPVELVTGQRKINEVVSLPPKGTITFQYVLDGRKRGVYAVGPLTLTSGDIFGLGETKTRYIASDFLVVYPRIVAFNRVALPSRSPMGSLRDTQPMYEDPTRVRGKRDYVSGDSLRRVDWKATAASGRLQVKLFEPSIALETAIFLNLNSSDYEHHSRIVASELSITVAASLANWIILKKQSVGLFTNGIEPVLSLEESGNDKQKPRQPFLQPAPIPPRRGRGHLMRLLEALAKVQVAETYPLVDLLRQQTPRLAWGTTLLLITPHFDEDFFEGLFHANRAGLKAVLIPCGPVSGVDEIRRKAEYFGFPFYQVYSEKDLDRWRNG